VTPSTTNTAAREVGCDTRSDLAKGMHRAYLLGMRVADGDIEPEQALAQLTEMTATLTQQQGGEQEVSWQNIETADVELLNNLAEKGGLADPVPGMLRHCAKLIDGLARFKTRATAPPDRYETEEEGDAFAHGYVAGFDDAKVATNA